MRGLIKSSVFCFIFFFPIAFAVASKDQIPPVAIKAEQAIVKINIPLPNGEKAHGTGFFVKNKNDKTFIATDFHVIQKYLLGKTGIEAKTLSGQNVQIVGVANFSFFTDLALLEVADYKGPVLQLSDFEEVKNETSYLMGFPRSFSDKFKQIKITGLVSDSKTALSGFSYFSNIKGVSGGPLLNREGAVIGVAQGENSDHMVYCTKSHFLQELLTKTESQKSKLDRIARFKEEAISLSASVKTGDPEAQHRLGIMYIDPEILNDPENGSKWMERAMQNGNTRVLYSAGKASFLEKNYERAFRIWEIAAGLGHPVAMLNLGFLYIKGQGVSKHFEKGTTWLKKAKERKNPEAISTLAAMYITGNGVNQNIEKGRTLLNELAEEGFAPALEVLKYFKFSSPTETDKGKCYTSIRGISTD